SAHVTACHHFNHVNTNARAAYFHDTEPSKWSLLDFLNWASSSVGFRGKDAEHSAFKALIKNIAKNNKDDFRVEKAQKLLDGWKGQELAQVLAKSFERCGRPVTIATTHFEWPGASLKCMGQELRRSSPQNRHLHILSSTIHSSKLIKESESVTTFWKLWNNRKVQRQLNNYKLQRTERILQAELHDVELNKHANAIMGVLAERWNLLKKRNLSGSSKTIQIGRR
ncbi:hypothetical protein BC936DRAFT_138055, partial [Jimgerdemannia flammicorona]